MNNPTKITGIDRFPDVENYLSSKLSQWRKICGLHLSYRSIGEEIRADFILGFHECSSDIRSISRMPFLSSYDQKLIPDERPGEN